MEAFDQRNPDVDIPETVEVRLKRPLKKTAGEETLTTLTFRTPSFKQLRMINDVQKKKDALAATVEMLVMLSADQLVEPDIDRLAALDFQRCEEAIGPFLVLAPPKTDD